jgi:hypothetical protein
LSAGAGERVREHFAAASELEGAERERYQERQCADPAVRAEVRSLLAEPVEAGFLDEPMVAPDVLGRLEAAAGPQRPERMGPYRIVGDLGEGSAGAVYLAEQEGPVRRMVALKVLHAGANTRRVMARFRAEGRALAAMDHPNIARLYDVRTAEDGRLYFVMERVDGEPLTRFCAARGLGRGERLALLAAACAAVQHAHGKGVIHRDLKPSNILAFDGPGGPGLKIIDFGVAKIAAGEGDGGSVTEHGAVLGTLAYMSPEQVDGRADARSDVYSLGSLAYEVLTGRLPVEVAGAPLSEAIRRVREDAPAPAGRVDRGLRGDAEAILARALAKEPERRYASADALGDDLRRLARGEPVVARGAGTLYVPATLARRHRRAAAGIGLWLVVVLAALGAGAAGFVRARAAESLTARAEQATLESLRFATRHALAKVDGGVRSRTVREVFAARLDADTSAMMGLRPGDPVVLGLRADVLNERSRLLLEAGDAAGALGLRREAGALRERALALRPGDPDIESERSIDMVLMGDALGELGDAPARREWYERAAEVQARLVAERGSPFDECRLAWGHLRLSALSDGPPGARIAHAEASLALCDRVAREDPADLSALDCALQVHGILEGIMAARGDRDASDRHFAAREELANRLRAADPGNRLYALDALRVLFTRAERSDAAGAAALDQEGFEQARMMLVLDSADQDANYLAMAFGVRLAVAAAARGDRPGAREMLGNVVEFCEQYPGTAPHRATVHAWLCAVTEPVFAALAGDPGVAALRARLDLIRPGGAGG